MPRKTELAVTGDGRAIIPESPIRRSRARTSSRKRGTSQATTRPPTNIRVPAKRSSRRKAGAEASTPLQTSVWVPPQPKSAAGHSTVVTQTTDAHGGPIDEIREQWRRRQMWHRAEKSLTLQAKSMCRRLLAGDKKEAEVLYKSSLNGGEHELAAVAYMAMHPLLDARDGIEKARLLVEKSGDRLVREIFKALPGIGEFVENTRGFGRLSFFGIVGEAGDLGNYSNPAKLWKRMGLAVIGGERQRRHTDQVKAVEHGYNPARRSLMWTVGDCIIRAGGPLKELYNQRKEYEAPRVATKMHAHNRAKRYIEKRLLRDLWRAWRDATAALPSVNRTHPSDHIPSVESSLQ